jgi:DNA-binding CsgD family transcriptional regulator
VFDDRTSKDTVGLVRAAKQRVVELVAAGHTYREIGERLFISRRTVETHVAHVFTKLNLKSKTELAEAYSTRAEASSPDIPVA